jgi:hypothetical protein
VLTESYLLLKSKFLMVVFSQIEAVELFDFSFDLSAAFSFQLFFYCLSYLLLL